MMPVMIESLCFLVVEDHEFQRDLLHHALAQLGVRTILFAKDGLEAKRLLESRGGSIHIVISDLMLPGMDGIELMPVLRRNAPTASVLLTSAELASLEAAEVIARASGLRVLGAVPKPLTPEKLRPLLSAYGDSGAG